MSKTFGSEFSFVCSPLYDNWFKLHHPKSSLSICSPYIKKNALDNIISLYGLNAQGPDFELKVLLRGNPEEFIHQKSSDISIFDSLLPIGESSRLTIRRVTNLHMKAYLIDNQHLLISSGNLTGSGIFAITGRENFEGGISTSDPRILADFRAYFDQIWAQGQPFKAFYAPLIAAYTDYIESDCSDRQIFQRLQRNKYHFPTKTELAPAPRPLPPQDGTAPTPHPASPGLSGDKPLCTDWDTFSGQAFSLDDIPPVGKLSHIPAVLEIVQQYPDGISFSALGRKLRPLFSENPSEETGTDRKFGEEKGKFAAFLDLVVIKKVGREKRISITQLGRLYQTLSVENKNRLVKDIFFHKPIVVSIMRQSLCTNTFNLRDFLYTNCVGASRTTLSRKVAPIKDLFSHIQSICEDDELRQALSL